MSDMMEKLLNEEQNTDKKFVDAANFFISLKEKTKEARYAKPQASKKPAKLKAEAAQTSKSIVRKGGAVPVKMNRANIKNTGNAVTGVSSVPTGRSLRGYKKLPAPTQKPVNTTVAAKPNKKAKVVVKVGSASKEDRKQELVLALSKEASLFQMGANLAKGVGQAAGKAGKNVGRRSGDFGSGYSSSGNTAIGNFGRNVKTGIGNFLSKGGGTEKWLNAAGAPFSMPGLGTATVGGIKKTKNLFRNADEVALETRLAGKLNKYRQTMPAADDAAAMAKYKKGLKKLEAKNARRMADFRQGQNLRLGTGLPETQRSIMQAITGANGKITPGSVWSGAKQLGIADTGTLVGLGLSGKRTMDAAKAARAATAKENALKWGAAGAVGIGGLALLKSKKNSNNQNV